MTEIGIQNNIRIRLRSQIYDLCTPELNEPEQAIKGDPISFSENSLHRPSMDDIIELTTEGILLEHDNQIEIVYEETEEMGMEDSRTALLLDKDNPRFVSMARSGKNAASFIFDAENRRQQCMYQTEFFPIELCICTNSVYAHAENLSGKISLDYTIEVRGVKTERNMMVVEFAPLSEDF